MVKDSLGGCRSIDRFVEEKLRRFNEGDKTMCRLFEFVFAERQNVFAEITDGYRIKRITYGECYETVVRKAKRLVGLLDGVPQGSIIGLCLDNRIEWIEMFWAILLSGFRPLLFNTRLDGQTLNSVVRDFDVKAVISLDTDFDTLNLHLDEITSCDDKVCFPEFANEIFLMSSNTSSNLKICGYTGEQFFYQISDSVSIIKQSRPMKQHYNGNLKLLTFLPFYHIFGLSAVYIWFAFFSRTLVFLRDFNPKTILNTVKKHEVTHIFSVPVFWETVYQSAMSAIRERGDKTYGKFCRGLRIADKLAKSTLLSRAFSKMAFREVRNNLFGESICFMINGGGQLSCEVFRFFNGIGYHLANGYGMTEIGITSVELSDKPSVLNTGSVGLPFASLEYSINGNGELLVRGRSMSHKICSDSTVRIVGDAEWINTHDLFSCENGRYYIHGRVDDLIVCSNGENLNPNLIEEKFSVNNVQKVCIIASDNRRNAVLLAQTEKYTDSEGLHSVYEALTARVSELKLETVIGKVLLTSSPLLGPNDFKLNRRQIAARLAAGEIRITDPDKPMSESDEADDGTEARIREIFAAVLNRSPEEIPLDAHFFFELGGTSLDYFTMITEVQHEFGVSFPYTVNGGVSSVREMAKHIKNAISQNIKI